MTLEPDGPDFLARLPKAELHLHLEGTITPDTWLELIRRHEPATSLTTADLAERMRFASMDGFFDVWMQVLMALREPEDYRMAAYACGRDLARHNVLYAELHTSIAGAEWSGRLRAGEVIPAIAEGLDAARREGGPEWRLIVDVIRDLAAAGDADLGLRIALDNRRHGVAAIGLGGSEARFPAEPAREVFRAAAEAGLHRTIHAGEAAGPESIREALDLGAERIGHAVTAAADPGLVEDLAARGIPLEMCPSSNVATGAVPTLSAHPLGAFLRRGLRVTLNTDDPALFGTNPTREYRRAVEAFRLSRAEVIRLARNAFEAAFVPNSEKDLLLSRFDSIMGR